jgi:hypothetical protein
MKALAPVAIIFLGLIFMNMSCEKENDSVNPNQCIRATVIYTGCLGLSFVQVHNADIGTPWQYGDKEWDNVIAVNLPYTIKTDSIVSFTLERQAKDVEDVCDGQSGGCNTNIGIPRNIFCAKNISAEKCSSTDEK